MSCQAVLAGLKAAYDTIPELAVNLPYVPSAIQDTPLLYTCLEGDTAFDDASDAEDTRFTAQYGCQSRLVVAWQDHAQAELTVAAVIDGVKAALEADPTLGGALADGQVVLRTARPGWLETDAGAVTHRIVDFYLEVWEV